MSKRYTSKQNAYIRPLPLIGFVLMMAVCFLIGRYVLGPGLRTANEETMASPAFTTSPSRKPAAPSVARSERPTVSAVEVTIPPKPVLSTPEPVTDTSTQLTPTPAQDQHPVLLPPDTVVSTSINEPDSPPHLYIVQAGVFSTRAAAERAAETLRRKGLAPAVVTVTADDRTLHHVRAGSVRDRDNAEKLAEQVRAAGLDAYILSEP